MSQILSGQMRPRFVRFFATLRPIRGGALSYTITFDRTIEGKKNDTKHAFQLRLGFFCPLVIKLRAWRQRDQRREREQKRGGGKPDCPAQMKPGESFDLAKSMKDANFFAQLCPIANFSN